MTPEQLERLDAGLGRLLHLGRRMDALERTDVAECVGDASVSELRAKAERYKAKATTT